MDKPHKKIVTTYPVAIMVGQTRIHIPDPIPWHVGSQILKCQKCETEFITTSGFPIADLQVELNQHHEKGVEHPDYLSSAPEWTRIADCDCPA
jgi:hypothetical protein